MSKIFESAKAKVTIKNKDVVLKWGFLLGAGLLTLISGIFDTRSKDRAYDEALNKKLDEKIDKTLTIRLKMDDPMDGTK